MKPKLCVFGGGQLAEAIVFGLNQYPSACEQVNFEEADVLWMADDTPIVDDVPQTEYVVGKIEGRLHYRSTSVLVIVSSQLPVGTIAGLETAWPIHRFVCVPENIRVSHNIQDWLRQERMIVGGRLTEHHSDLDTVSHLCRYFTQRVIWMDTESAEMVKSALNVFLAICVSYSNELADICKQVGADPEKVAEGLLSDSRVGDRAYLRPTGPYTSGHLEREVYNLLCISQSPGVIAGAKLSNDIRLMKEKSK